MREMERVEGNWVKSNTGYNILSVTGELFGYLHHLHLRRKQLDY